MEQTKVVLLGELWRRVQSTDNRVQITEYREQECTDFKIKELASNSLKYKGGDLGSPPLYL